MTKVVLFACVSFINTKMKKHIIRKIYKESIDRYIGGHAG
jgi:hypothetical protein